MSSNTPFTLIYIFLVLSGVYSIIVSLKKLTSSRKQDDPESTLQTKIFKYTAPAGFVYGILSILLVVIIVKFDITGELTTRVQTLEDENKQLLEENNYLKGIISESKKNEPELFSVEVKNRVPKSLFSGTVLIEYTYNAFSKNTIKFSGVIGAAGSIKEKFKNETREIAIGDRFYIQLITYTIYGINVLDSIEGIKLEFFKVESETN